MGITQNLRMQLRVIILGVASTIALSLAPWAAAAPPPNAPPDWPRAGGFGPSGSGTSIIDTIVGDTSRREWSDEDLKSMIEIATRISPRWASAMEERFAKDPEEMRRSLRGGARRMGAMLVLREKAPKVFEAKVAELRAGAESQRALDELMQGKARGATPKELATLEAALTLCASTEVDLALKTRTEELSALADAMARFQDELVADEQRREELTARLLERLHAPGRENREGREGRNPRPEKPRLNPPPEPAPSR